MLAQVDQIIARNRNIHSYVTAARLIADDPLIYDQNMIYVHAKMQYMSGFVWSVAMAHIILTDGLESACDYVDLGSAYDACWTNITVDKVVDQSECSVAASYKPPMLVTRVRLPACECLKVLSWWLTGWRSYTALLFRYWWADGVLMGFWQTAIPEVSDHSPPLYLSVSFAPTTH